MLPQSISLFQSISGLDCGIELRIFISPDRFSTLKEEIILGWEVQKKYSWLKSVVAPSLNVRSKLSLPFIPLVGLPSPVSEILLDEAWL